MRQPLRLTLTALLTLFAAATVCAGDYGAPMPAEGTPLPLGAAIEQAEDAGRYEGKIRGRITQVCRRKGCFMVLADDRHAARVTFKDYGFFVPTDTAPGMTTVFGELTARPLTPEEANHYAADAGRPGEATAAVREYSIIATAVHID